MYAHRVRKLTKAREHGEKGRRTTRPFRRAEHVFANHARILVFRRPWQITLQSSPSLTPCAPRRSPSLSRTRIVLGYYIITLLPDFVRCRSLVDDLCVAVCHADSQCVVGHARQSDAVHSGLTAAIVYLRVVIEKLLSPCPRAGSGARAGPCGSARAKEPPEHTR